MKHVLVILSICLFSACSTVKSTRYHYPDEIKDMCKAEISNAKTCIENKGVKLIERAVNVSIVKIDGQRKFKEGWGWKSTEWNGAWVLGLTHYTGNLNYRIEIGCNPTTKQEINPLTVRHEAGHYWLMSNYNDNTHNEKYKSCFEGWRDWRDMQVKTATIRTNDEIIVIDYIEE